MMFTLGSEQRWIIVKVKSPEKAEKMAAKAMEATSSPNKKRTRQKAWFFTF